MILILSERGTLVESLEKVTGITVIYEVFKGRSGPVSGLSAQERGQSYSRVRHVRFMGNQWGQSTRTKPELFRCMGCMLESDIRNVIFKHVPSRKIILNKSKLSFVNLYKRHGVTNSYIRCWYNVRTLCRSPLIICLIKAPYAQPSLAQKARFQTPRHLFLSEM